jgi:hypothetical protein
MILRLTRIPAGFGRAQIIGLLGGRPAKITTHKVVGALAILTVPKGTVKDVITLLDHGFTLEVIQW